MLASSHNSSNSTVQELRAAKLGLAALMFVYVCTACYLPTLVLYLFNKYAKKSNKSSNPDQPNHDPSSNQQSSETGLFECIKWSQGTKQKLIGRANCLAAGALLSVGLLDVFMDTMECVEDARTALKIKTEAPIASLLTLFGFFLVLGAEQIAMAVYESQNRKYHPNEHLRLTEQNQVPGALVRRKNSDQPLTTNDIPPTNELSEQVTVFSGANSTPHQFSTCENEQLSHPDHHHHHHHHHGAHSTILKTDISFVQALLLLFALSLHSIFEGLALGLCDSVTLLLTRFGAVSLHKLFIAISIGISLATDTSKFSSVNQSSNYCRCFKSKTQLLRLLAIFLFAGASPLGTLIGWSISSRSSDARFLTAEAILQGLACGTFFYVVFCELLPREFNETSSDKVAKFLFLLIGFAIIALVICLLPGE